MNLIEKLLYIPDFLNGYGMGDPERNGEYRFLRNFVKDRMVIFDVGANVGEYTEYAFQHAQNLEIHTFEPVAETFAELKRRVTNKNLNAEIYFNNFGMSNKIEEKEIIIYNHLAGSNSMYYNPEIASKSKSITKEIIKLSTVDDYIAKNNINLVDFMKVDVEGYESNVIFGADDSFNKNIIKAIQFEYGGFWKNSDSSLKDVLEFLSDHSFIIYRLALWGKLRIHVYSESLCNFKHSNYIALCQKFNS